MKNIIDLATELIKENGPTDLNTIAKAIDNPTLSKKKIAELRAVVYNDLLIDGNFILVDDKWDLKINYTMKDVAKEQYRAIGSLAFEEDEDTGGLKFEDEPELIIASDDDEDESQIDNVDIFEEFEEI